MYIDKNFENSWKYLESRQDACLTLLEETDKSILDLGAGQMYVKSKIDSSIKYYPIDFFKRFDETIVCDFNKYEYPNIYSDVAICSGILEWIVDYEWLIREICSHSKKIIISYATLEEYGDLNKRNEFGWMNWLSNEKLINLFFTNGKVIDRKIFDEGTQQSIYCFIDIKK